MGRGGGGAGNCPWDNFGGLKNLMYGQRKACDVSQNFRRDYLDRDKISFICIDARARLYFRDISQH